MVQSGGTLHAKSFNKGLYCVSDAIPLIPLAGVVLEFAILKGRPNSLKKGQFDRFFGGKEGQFYSQYEATLCSFKECEIESLATD